MMAGLRLTGLKYRQRNQSHSKDGPPYTMTDPVRNPMISPLSVTASHQAEQIAKFRLIRISY